VISRESPVAPWRQVYCILKEEIASGELKPGSRLPSNVDLSKEHDLALATVQKALDRLRDEGLVVTSPMGTFVSEKPKPD